MLRRALLLFALVAGTVVFAYNPNEDYNYRSTMNQSRTAVFCYINGTRLQRQAQLSYPSSPFTLESVNIDLCTHILYGAAEIDQNYQVRAISSDLENRQSSANKISLDDLIGLKNHKRELKVLISISGNPATWSALARGSRQPFIQSLRNFLGRHKFDGVNIDWQYPTRRGGQSEDKQNYAELMKELKIQLRGEAKLLTTYVSPIKAGMMESYDFTNNDLMEAIDYWIVLSTEYYGHAYNTIGANAPLESRDMYSVSETVSNLKYALKQHSYKIILVVPFYGKKYLLPQNSNNHESPFGKEFTNRHVPAENVILTYREICHKMSLEPEWRREWDRISETPYIVKENNVILYDDAESVAKKTSYAIRQGLGGVMAFSIEMDDFDGDCSYRSTDGSRRTGSDYNSYGSRDRSTRKYPLLQAIVDTVERGPNSAGIQSSPLALVLVSVGALLLKLYG